MVYKCNWNSNHFAYGQELSLTKPDGLLNCIIFLYIFADKINSGIQVFIVVRIYRKHLKTANLSGFKMFPVDPYNNKYLNTGINYIHCISFFRLQKQNWEANSLTFSAPCVSSFVVLAPCLPDFGAFDALRFVQLPSESRTVRLSNGHLLDTFCVRLSNGKNGKTIRKPDKKSGFRMVLTKWPPKQDGRQKIFG